MFFVINKLKVGFKDNSKNNSISSKIYEKDKGQKRIIK